MTIFNSDAYVSAKAAQNYLTTMKLTHPNHMMPPDSPYQGSGSNIINLRNVTGAQAVTRAGAFEDALLLALDKVSASQLNASDLQQKAIIDPDSVDIHDITIAQAEATMALNITRNVLSRVIQGWRDLINTR